MKRLWALLLVGTIGCVHPGPPNPLPTPTPTPLPPKVCEPACLPGARCVDDSCVSDPTVCPLKLPLIGYGMDMRIGPHGTTGQQHDTTPFIKKGNDPALPWPPPGWTGACRPLQCDLGAEKDPDHGDVCSRTLCGETIDYVLEPADSGIINWVQGYTVKITMAKPGRLLGTCSANTAVSTSIPVP